MFNNYIQSNKVLNLVSFRLCNYGLSILNLNATWSVTSYVPMAKNLLNKMMIIKGN